MQLRDAYLAYNQNVRAWKKSLENAQVSVMGWVDSNVLGAIETASGHLPESALPTSVARMSQLLATPETMKDDGLRAEFKALYKASLAIAAPAYAIYIEHCHALQELATDDTSLDAIRSERLLDIEAKRFNDGALQHYSRKFCEVMPHVSQAPAIEAYRGAFEVYAEARAYIRLLAHLPVSRVSEGDSSTPDFKCEFGGKTFYVEVKTLDVLGGLQKKLELQMEAMASEIELREKVKLGARVASAARVVAPYKRNKGDPVASNSIHRVIETIRENSRRAIKTEQFAHGPTILAVVLDRLVIPGNECTLVKFGERGLNWDQPVSGALWNACFGKEGDTVYTYADRRDPPWTDGSLKAPGFLVDPTNPFPGIGVLFLSEYWSTSSIYGLFDEQHLDRGGWSPADTELVLRKICDEFNDSQDSRAPQTCPA